MPGFYVQASLVAKPFFERRGFVVVHENRVEKSGQVLINFSMEKCLILKNNTYPTTHAATKIALEIK